MVFILITFLCHMKYRIPLSWNSFRVIHFNQELIRQLLHSKMLYTNITELLKTMLNWITIFETMLVFYCMIYKKLTKTLWNLLYKMQNTKLCPLKLWRQLSNFQHIQIAFPSHGFTIQYYNVSGVQNCILESKLSNNFS